MLAPPPPRSSLRLPPAEPPPWPSSRPPAEPPPRRSALAGEVPEAAEAAAETMVVGLAGSEIVAFSPAPLVASLTARSSIQARAEGGVVCARCVKGGGGGCTPSDESMDNAVDDRTIVPEQADRYVEESLSL